MRTFQMLALVFVLVPSLRAADPAGFAASSEIPFSMPTTDQEWKKIKAGFIQIVELKVAENHTRIMLKEGQSVRIVPNSDDRWWIEAEAQSQTPVSWCGEAGKGPARSKRLQVMVYPDTTEQGKPVTDETKKSLLTHYWTNISDLDNFVWSGPGEIVFRGEFGNDYRGAGKGAIRVKLVAIKNDQTVSR